MSDAAGRRPAEITSASRNAPRKRLSRLAQVFEVTPCAAGRILAIIALKAGASAGTVGGDTLAISQIRLMAEVMSRW
jgi:hypothetical protein